MKLVQEGPGIGLGIQGPIPGNHVTGRVQSEGIEAPQEVGRDVQAGVVLLSRTSRRAGTCPDALLVCKGSHRKRPLLENERDGAAEAVGPYGILSWPA